MSECDRGRLAATDLCHAGDRREARFYGPQAVWAPVWCAGYRVQARVSRNRDRSPCGSAAQSVIVATGPCVRCQHASIERRLERQSTFAKLRLVDGFRAQEPGDRSKPPSQQAAAEQSDSRRKVRRPSPLPSRRHHRQQQLRRRDFGDRLEYEQHTRERGVVGGGKSCCGSCRHQHAHV